MTVRRDLKEGTCAPGNGPFYRRITTTISHFRNSSIEIKESPLESSAKYPTCQPVVNKIRRGWQHSTRGRAEPSTHPLPTTASRPPNRPSTDANLYTIILNVLAIHTCHRHLALVIVSQICARARPGSLVLSPHSE